MTATWWISEKKKFLPIMCSCCKCLFSQEQDNIAYEEELGWLFEEISFFFYFLPNSFFRKIFSWFQGYHCSDIFPIREGKKKAMFDQKRLRAGKTGFFPTLISKNSKHQFSLNYLNQPFEKKNLKIWTLFISGKISIKIPGNLNIRLD